MFEVKIHVNVFEGNRVVAHTFTIATFDTDPGTYRSESDAIRFARARAIGFAKQIDKGFAVDVVEVANEDNRDKAFGLVYHRDAVAL